MVEKVEGFSPTLDGLVFHHGESSGTIDLTRQPQADLAKIAIDMPLAAAKALINVNRAFMKLFARMYGADRAA